MYFDFATASGLHTIQPTVVQCIVYRFSWRMGGLGGQQARHLRGRGRVERRGRSAPAVATCMMMS